MTLIKGNFGRGSIGEVAGEPMNFGSLEFKVAVSFVSQFGQALLGFRFGVSGFRIV